MTRYKVFAEVIQSPMIVFHVEAESEEDAVNQVHSGRIPSSDLSSKQWYEGSATVRFVREADRIVIMDVEVSSDG